MHDAHRADCSSLSIAHRRAWESGVLCAHPAHQPNRLAAMVKKSRHIYARCKAPLTLALTLAMVFLSSASAVNAQIIVSGGFHNCTSTAAGGVVCWGDNDNGQLGDNSTITRAKPVNVIGLPFGSTALAAGHGSIGHTCAVTSIGGVKCWGGNNSGQLGDTSTTQRLTPVDVPGVNGISRVIAGDSFSCALSTTGGIQCWGRNDSGQLGDGTGPSADKLVPVTVSGFGSMAGATALAGSYNHACAVNSAGGAVCWGENFGRQLGDGSMANFQNVPVAVTGLGTGIASVAAGSNHSCALTISGGVKCWGDKSYGEIGDGTFGFGMSQPTPVDVSGLTSGVIAITAGQYHTCALTSGGGVMCWGNNTQGQIGDGTNTQRNAPVQVTSISSGAIAISAGVAHTCALFSTGVSSCWGNNPNGQIGNGTIGGTTYVPVPTQYPSVTSTTLASGLNPSIFGDNVTFTATVTGGVNGTAVAFQNGGVNIAGCGAQALVSGAATCTTSALGAGTYSIKAIYQGNANTLASSSGAIPQVVNPANQTIIFDPLANKQDNDPPFTVLASASSGLTVTFSSTTTAVCTVSGSSVTLTTTAGTCTIAANQLGNGNFNAAPQVSQSFTVLSSGPALALTTVVSRKAHGAAGTFDIAINPATLISGLIDVEPRAIGAGHTIIFGFNNSISSTGTVTSVDAASVAIGSATAAISGNNIVVTLTGIPDNRRAKVTLTGVNGTGLVASASIGFLIGDQNNSRSITGTDIGVVRGRSGQAVTSVNFKSDLNASGTLTGTDVSIVRPRSGLVIPP